VHSITHWSSCSRRLGLSTIKATTAQGRTALQLIMPPAKGECFWCSAGWNLAYSNILLLSDVVSEDNRYTVREILGDLTDLNPGRVAKMVAI